MINIVQRLIPGKRQAVYHCCLRNTHDQPGLITDMINDGFHCGFGLLGGCTCNRERLEKSGETHYPCNRPGTNKRNGLSEVQLLIMFVIISVTVLSNFYHKLQTSLFSSGRLYVFHSSSHPFLLHSSSSALSMKLMLQLGPSPQTRLSLQLVYPHRGLKYAPLSEPPRRENERDVSPQNPGKVPGSNRQCQN